MNIHTTRVSQHEIQCDLCGKCEGIRTDDGEWKWNDSPTRYFKRIGWKEVAGKTLCPECANLKGEM